MPVESILGDGPTADPLALPDGITLEGFRKRVGVERVDQAADLEDYLRGAVSMAGAVTRRELVALQAAGDPPAVLQIRARGSDLVRVPDVRELVAVTADGQPVDVELVELLPTPPTISAPAPRIRLPYGADRVTVTGRFGFGPLPALLVDAIYAHAGRNYREKEALYADSIAIGAGEGGGALYSYFRQLPPRVKAAYDLFCVTSDWWGL